MFFFFNDTATTEIYTLSLHDALPIFARFVSVAATRASNCSVASVLAPWRISCSQAAMRNACSERKPRSLTAARTWPRSSPEGNRKLREKPFLSPTHPSQARHHSGTTFCSKWCQAKPKKCKWLSRKNATKWPQPFMFQYPCLSHTIHIHFMHAAPIRVENSEIARTLVKPRQKA